MSFRSTERQTPGHYSFTLAELVTKGHLRPLKEASEAENVA
ncbi:hypothetical protein [Escherichia coli]|nr:hypothetical protein [Escherichia coli]